MRYLVPALLLVVAGGLLLLQGFAAEKPATDKPTSALILIHKRGSGVVTHRLTDQPEQSFQLIWPYTDLLLHDMGEGLADQRPEFAASGRDWRTPPLWGLGLSRIVNGSGVMLHDGRARNATEAILWHGGEAQASRESFERLSKRDRDALLAFLNAI